MKVALPIILYVTSCWSFPTKEEVAEVCNPTECLIANNCRCSSTTNPIDSSEDPAPQLIAITVSESVVQTVYDKYLTPLFFNKTNSDGGQRGYTFYVNHEYTDYSLVQDLYLRGYEIGVHSITKNTSQEYWRNAPLEDLQAEFGGQKTILETFAGIPEEDIVGARTPQLQIEEDVTIQAYIDSGITYDNSWPATSSNRVLPYTLDYASTQQCTVAEKCPTESHPGFWIAPITNILGADGQECNSLATCNVEGTADEIAQWLIGQVDIVRGHNRAPLVIRLDSYWFEQTENSFDGFSKFLDQVTDVFFVSVQDVLEWIKNPVPASQYATPVHDDRYAECLPASCHYQGEERYMVSCVPCPPNYPWIGNPLGE